MNLKLYDKFLKETFNLIIKEKEGNFVKKGKLINKDVSVNIKNFIPRFYEENYCESFSFQWKKFKNLQLDSVNRFKHSEERIVNCTKWNLKKLKGKTILECGCGPGRFTEIFLKYGAIVVGIDMSNAIDVNFENNGKNKNLLLIQGDITKMNFLYNKFDYVFCYGVLQHTPDPKKTFTELHKYLSPGGKISVDSYRKLFIPTGWSTPKYLWRPITKRMDKEKLLKIIKWYIPKYIEFDTLIRRIPKIGIILTGIIPVPCWNYLDKGYSKRERINHAIMDTFDALSPKYDFPKTISEIKE
jgi:2-polyprenyl-3-methyl-5-hydroxy-6-metoxy-1,4-benzoquinol methylase